MEIKRSIHRYRLPGRTFSTGYMEEDVARQMSSAVQKAGMSSLRLSRTPSAASRNAANPK